MTSPKAKTLINTLKKAHCLKLIAQSLKANHILQIWKIIQSGIGEELRN
jgi:hypothetical protein